MLKTGLIADIGATNARFALVTANGIESPLTLQCEDHLTIVDAVRAYLDEVKPEIMPSSASFAIAGPVKGDWFEMTNHSWRFSIEKTKAALGLSYFELMNDFKAIALGVPHLGRDDLRQIGEGNKISGAPIGIIGPGTGLGVASLVWDGAHYIPVPGEGGHVTMPAKNQREFDIFKQLRVKYRHVSAERVISGKGLINIYNSIRVLDNHIDLPDRTAEEISAAALDNQCRICVESLDLMMGFLGSIAGNLALTLGAFGGIYIAGGIVMKQGESFYKSRFYDQFLAKGRFKEYLEPIPVYVITHPSVAFVGLQADLLRFGHLSN